MADLASMLQGRPEPQPLSGPPILPNIMPREMRREPLGQSNLLSTFLRSFGQPSLDALRGGMEGTKTPQEVARTFLETGPIGPFGVARAMRPRGFQPIEFTGEMREATRQGYLANEPESVIADRVGVAIGTLRRHLPAIREEFGLPIRQRVGRYGPPPTVGEIRAAYDSGATTAPALASALGRSRRMAAEYLADAGLAPGIAPRSADTVDQVRRLREQGASYGDISSSLGLTRNQVAGMIRDLRARGVAVPAILTSGAMLGAGTTGIPNTEE
jgi:hypothetical protein